MAKSMVVPTEAQGESFPHKRLTDAKFSRGCCISLCHNYKLPISCTLESHWQKDEHKLQIKT